VNPKSFVILVTSSPSRHVDFVHVVNAREVLASKYLNRYPVSYQLWQLARDYVIYLVLRTPLCKFLVSKMCQLASFDAAGLTDVFLCSGSGSIMADFCVMLECL
jgi:hypothetical protein